MLDEGGPLLSDFEQILPTWVLPKQAAESLSGIKGRIKRSLFIRSGLQGRLDRFRSYVMAFEPSVVFINSVASIRLYEQLDFLHTLPVVLFAHELGMSVDMYSDEHSLKKVLASCKRLLVVSDTVADFYAVSYGVPRAKIRKFTLIDTQLIKERFELADRSRLSREHALPENAFIVGGCGNAELRKGNDLFNWIAAQVNRTASELPIYFVWVGADERHAIFKTLRDDIEKLGLAVKIILVPPTEAAFDYIGAFSVLLLTSREDPYPLVVLESAFRKIPTICFEKTGGAREFVEHDAGVVLPYMDIVGAANTIIDLYQKPEVLINMGEAAQSKLLTRHDTARAMKSFYTYMAELRQ